MQSLNLNLNKSVGSQSRETATLPAFVASMGEPVVTGIRFVDEIGGDGAHANDEGGNNEEDLLERDEDGMCETERERRLSL